MANQLEAESAYSPRPVSLPPAPDVKFWSEQQWTTFFALADAVIPSIRTAATVNSSADKVISTGEWDTTITKLSTLIPGPDAAALAKEYLEEDVSSNPIFRATVQRIIGNHVHEEGKNGFGLVLNALKYVNTDTTHYCIPILTLIARELAR
jgi:hypothetical protein